ncbi:MAG: hypothetical protein EI684_12305 [Candidatus Viridilinea halotolerans]|uniref:Uncharacterized protein n=1 Tax=Candidatus Viridilinea halotolerans TaxID=2491704 RepID=A0A426TYH7_9CHLR|nr:MAG: hypothetical protein EI684_12305 [Candidatus Viridilinea halotolerans]
MVHQRLIVLADTVAVEVVPYHPSDAKTRLRLHIYRQQRNEAESQQQQGEDGEQGAVGEAADGRRGHGGWLLDGIGLRSAYGP